jgi:tetratricopeptide (TPR) repeat protein
LEKSPDNPIILTGKALLFARMGRNEEAEALNDESLGRNDNYANALVVRGLVCYNMGKYDKA